ncbi:hypothetical protein [Methanolapillus africanus]|uniref:hypothetical protein n=1 Tax=Methanolapillus africanus TaxID=3028297 RepID=UPI0030B86C88
MKIEIECDYNLLEIQIPIADCGLSLHYEMFGVCEEARSIYGETAGCFFLITRYQDY